MNVEDVIQMLNDGIDEIRGVIGGLYNLSEGKTTYQSTINGLYIQLETIINIRDTISDRLSEYE